MVKGGSTVPLKFEIFAGTTELTSTSIDGNPVGTFDTKRISCLESNAEETIDLTTTGSTSFRYDGENFIQNWKTPKSPGKCYEATFLYQDGIHSISALFKMK